MVTSEAGVANFWDLFGKKNPVGSFPMTEYEDENVFAMVTDLEESHLFAGDTLGIISVFSIQDYCSTEEVGVTVIIWGRSPGLDESFVAIQLANMSTIAS